MRENAVRKNKGQSPIVPGAPTWITRELVEDTLRVWQPYYQDPLTTEDAVSILVNVGALLDVLREGNSA
jgi:hypothetical protein